MVDVLTKKQRSYNMAMIRAVNTKPELKLRKLLSATGLRYRLHHRLTGRPDIVFVSRRVAVFIDGCFWHRCPKDFIKPETRRKFWLTKIARNVMRDKKVNRLLVQDGWKVLRVWEHDVRKNPERCRDRILAAVNQRKTGNA